MKIPIEFPERTRGQTSFDRDKLRTRISGKLRDLEKASKRNPKKDSQQTEKIPTERVENTWNDELSSISESSSCDSNKN